MMQYWVEYRYSFGALQPWTVLPAESYVYCGPTRPGIDATPNDGWVVEFKDSGFFVGGNMIRLLGTRGRHVYLYAAWKWTNDVTNGWEWELLYAKKPNQYGVRVRRS